jgi:ankyrin repeat protein
MANGSTPLSAAVSSGNESAVTYLLESGADPNLYGGSCHSPLQLAVYHSRLDLARLLVKKVDVNARGGLCGSPLHAAAWIGNVELVEMLLSHGASADLNARPFGTPLHALLFEEYHPGPLTRKITQLLFDGGAAIDAPDFGGRTPLMAAIPNHPESDIEMLLSLKADPNVRDSTSTMALHQAVLCSSVAMVEMFLKKGAHPTALDGRGRGTLYQATLSKTYDALEKFNALAQALPDTERKTHLSSAIPPAVARGTSSILEAILAVDDVDVNVPGRNGWTGL